MKKLKEMCSLNSVSGNEFRMTEYVKNRVCLYGCGKTALLITGGILCLLYMILSLLEHLKQAFFIVSFVHRVKR